MGGLLLVQKIKSTKQLFWQKICWRFDPKIIQKRHVVVLYGDGNPEMANGAIKQRQAHFNPWMCRAGFKDNFCGKYKHLMFNNEMKAQNGQLYVFFWKWNYGDFGTA